MFHVGQLVVCVDDSPSHYDPNWMPLNRGSIYTVEATEDNPPPGVRIEEVPLPDNDWWLATRFRPLDDTKLAVFRKLLEPLPEKQGEPA